MTPAGARFEIVPAWRIPRLRAWLRDAEQRGHDPSDQGLDLEHRALRRRFALGRLRAATPRRKLATTRKGRHFPLAKRVAIWRAILATRPARWAPGDRAPFGGIARAHELAVAACKDMGMASPRYGTIYALWHRGVPAADVLAEIEP